MPSKPSRSSTFRIAAVLFVAQLFGTSFGLAFNRSSLPSTSSSGHRQLIGRHTPTPGKRTIVAIGDLHGDLEQTYKVLELVNVLTPSRHWNPDSGVDVLVQVGDIADRGPNSREIFLLFKTLRVEAEKNGATVISVYGNHELQNLYGDWTSVNPDEISSYGGAENRQNALRQGWLGRDLRDNYLVTARVPLHSAVGPLNVDYDPASVERLGPLSHASLSFVHGGLNPKLEFSPYPSKLNALGKSAVRHLQDSKEAPKIFLTSEAARAHEGIELPKSVTRKEAKLLMSLDHPLWYRGWAKGARAEAKRSRKLRRLRKFALKKGRDEDWVQQKMNKANPVDLCPAVEATLAKYGIRRMIMGHTPDVHGIAHMCDGKVIVIDTGMTDYYGGVVAAIKFEYSLEPIKGKLGWYTEHDKVTAVYDGSDPEVIVDNTMRLDLGDIIL